MMSSLLIRSSGIVPRTVAPLAVRPLAVIPQTIQSARMSTVVPPENFNTKDNYYFENRSQETGENKRAFTYFVLGGSRVLFATATRVAVIKFVATMSAAADVLALASLEVDLAKVATGATITVKWRGKPVFIRNRTEAEIDEAKAVPMAELKDPQTDDVRASNPQWLVVLGVCTHLGCVPIANSGEYNGWFCPCHGSHYDVSGRIRKGPAPLNLEVPPYSFVTDSKVLIG